MMYMNRFFETKEAAKAFQKEHGGAFYSYVKGSRTKRSYLAEAAMRGMSMDDVEKFPYVVAWNEPNK